MIPTDQDISGFLQPAAEATEPSGSFCQFCELPSHGYNRLVKAQRYNRWWLLKGLKEEFREQMLYRQLLRKEFEIAMSLSLQHPAIVAVTGFEEVEELGPCIVMEWVDGITLGEWLSAGEANKRRSRKERQRIFLQLLDAMEYIHARQVAHRDLKPSNILVTCNGQQVKLIDFGLSDGDNYALFKQPVGTPGYVSPEQQINGSADLRNDLYSMGCVLQELRLGFTMQPIVRRCKCPIARRYANAGELRCAFVRATRLPLYAKATLLLLALLALIVPLARIAPHSSLDTPQVWNDKIQANNVYYAIGSVKKRCMDVVGCIPDEEGFIAIPDSVEFGGVWYQVVSIGNSGLSECGLRSIQFPNTSLGVINSFALSFNNFKSITLPNSVYSCLRGAFHSCRELESIEFGSQMRVIDIDAFAECSSLRHITIHTVQPPVMGECSFIDLGAITLHVPAESVELYKQAYEWKRFGKIVPL